ncbi:MAG: hypothetical protein VX444_05985 [Pseudomonadota bacterium]|nr:hypothetical protein [Pseudomonadota bacterium]
MPKIKSARTTAAPISRITFLKTGEDIGLLYIWDNEETLSALFEDGSIDLEVSEDRNRAAYRTKRE